MWTVIADGHRECIMCRKRKPLSEFYRCKYTTGCGNPSLRYDSRCKSCNRQRRRKSHAANPEKDRENSIRWREKNPARKEEYQRLYQASAHGRAVKAKIQRKRKHRLRALGSYSDQDIAEILKAQRHRCAGCRTKLDDRATIDHIIPIALGGTNARKNLQMLCVSCNSSKQAKPPETWYRQQGFLV